MTIQISSGLGIERSTIAFIPILSEYFNPRIHLLTHTNQIWLVLLQSEEGG